MRRTGKYAYVNGIPCTQSWQVTRASTAARYIASCVPDGSAAAEGNVNETGTMTGAGYLPPMPDEDDFDFKGVASAKSGEIVNYEGLILVSETTIAIPVAAGTPITWSANFGVQGELVKSGSPAYVDPTRNPAPSAKWGRIEIEDTLEGTGTGGFIAIPDVQNINLTFRRAAADLVDGGLTYREAGNVEAEMNFEVQTDDRDVSLYAVNGINRVRVYINETEFYMFDSMLWTNQGPFTVDRTNNSLIGYTVNGIWTALRERTPPDLGEILLPDSSPFYPTPGTP